jgi:hypothetical protein
VNKSGAAGLRDDQTFTAVPDICGSSVRSLLGFTLLGRTILKWFTYFWNNMHPWYIYVCMYLYIYTCVCVCVCVCVYMASEQIFCCSKWRAGEDDFERWIATGIKYQPTIYLEILEDRTFPSPPPRAIIFWRYTDLHWLCLRSGCLVYMNFIVG